MAERDNVNTLWALVHGHHVFILVWGAEQRTTECHQHVAEIAFQLNGYATDFLTPKPAACIHT